MVSPHPEWDDRDNGLSKENSEDAFSDERHITVRPVLAEFHEHSALVRAVKRGSENGYSIILEIGTPGDGAHDDVITFRSERSAWEFANLLTHYFAHTASPTAAKGDLLAGYQGTDDQWVPHRVIEELAATEAFEKLLFPHPTPDEMSDILG